MLIIPLCQVQLIKSFSALPIRESPALERYLNPVVINLDGDLKAAISPEQRDIIWKGRYAEEPEWFAGEIGRSNLSLGYDFSDPDMPVAVCDLQFVNARGNRPFAFMSTLNGAFPKMYLNETSNIVVHFDIKLDNFSCNRRSWLRTSVVVALQNDESPDRIFFEQDIKDNPRARAALPVQGQEVKEIYYADIGMGNWTHLDVPFEDFMQDSATEPFAQPFLSAPNSTFIESVYLVNECFGSGHIQYSLANWWITVEKTGIDGNAKAENAEITPSF